MRALYVAASGMNAQQTRLDNVANNLANVNTTGFKKARTAFQDLLYQELTYGGRSAAPGQVQVGGGVQLASIQKDHSGGSLTDTGDGMNVSVRGAGFIALEGPDGSLLYTRDGRFEADGDGGLRHATTGLSPAGRLQIPRGTDAMSFTGDGTLQVTRNGDPNPIAVGNLEVFQFNNPAGLRAIGGNLFAETETSGQALRPTEGTHLEVGTLENSNVDAAEELITMIMAQRAYELNSKVIQAADETMQLTANLRR